MLLKQIPALLSALSLQVALARFRRWSTLPRTKPVASKRPRQELLDQKLLPAFKNGRKLRDYQVGIVVPDSCLAVPGIVGRVGLAPQAWSYMLASASAASLVSVTYRIHAWFVWVILGCQYSSQPAAGRGRSFCMAHAVVGCIAASWYMTHALVCCVAASWYPCRRRAFTGW